MISQIGEGLGITTGDIMKKMITKIDENASEIFINGNEVTLKGKTYVIKDENGNLEITNHKGLTISIDDIINLDNNLIRIEIEGYTVDVFLEDPLLTAVQGDDDGELMTNSPLAGTISDIFVKVGDKVSSGEILLIISAMKMENKIIAKSEGIVKCININIGDQVNKGIVLIEFEK